jgi:hypothetical protein
VIQVSQQPPELQTTAIATYWCGNVADSRAYEKPRKVDSSIDCELERTPDAGIEFHQPGVLTVGLELRHDNPFELDRAEKLFYLTQALRVYWDALT